jgi:hypothetical protein
MAQRKSRRTPTLAVKEIKKRALEGERPIEIYNAMSQAGEWMAICPALRTVQDIVAEVVPPDASGEWHLGDATADDAAMVLPVLAAVIERTKGRTTRLTNGEAEWIARVTLAASDIPPWEAYHMARLYLSRTGSREPTDALDRALAFAPWRDGGKAYLAAFMAGWLDVLHWMEFAPEVEEAFIAAVEAREHASKEPIHD